MQRDAIVHIIRRVHVHFARLERIVCLSLSVPISLYVRFNFIVISFISRPEKRVYNVVISLGNEERERDYSILCAEKV